MTPPKTPQDPPQELTTFRLDRMQEEMDAVKLCLEKMEERIIARIDTILQGCQGCTTRITALERGEAVREAREQSGIASWFRVSPKVGGAGIGGLLFIILYILQLLLGGKADTHSAPTIPAVPPQQDVGKQLPPAVP